MIIIRKTKISDIKVLAGIYKKTYDATHNNESWNLTQAKALLEFYLKTKTFIGFTAIYDGKICGAFFSYIKPWWDGKHLAEGEIFVDPKYQGKKIGTQLYLVMMKSAMKKGCVIHEFLAYKKPGLWYEKIGFKPTKLIHMSGNIERVIKLILK